MDGSGIVNAPKEATKIMMGSIKTLQASRVWPEAAHITQHRHSWGFTLFSTGKGGGDYDTHHQEVRQESENEKCGEEDNVDGGCLRG